MEASLLVTTAAGMARPVLRDLRGLEAVQRADVVAGEFDVVAAVDAASNRDLLALVTEEVQCLEGIGRTRTCIVLE